jgi:hypothetical protein
MCVTKIVENKNSCSPKIVDNKNSWIPEISEIKNSWRYKQELNVIYSYNLLITDK